MMSNSIPAGSISLILHILVQYTLIVRVLLRPHREPASRIAWVVVILAVPVVGILAYIFLGETNIGRSRVNRIRTFLARLSDVFAAEAVGFDMHGDVPQTYKHLFHAGKHVNGFEPVGGNHATLLQDSNATIDSMVADIDAAQDHVHLLFYIWLEDKNGCKAVEAINAAARGDLPRDG